MVRKIYGRTPWERVLAHVRHDEATGCWEYLGARNRKGYGRVNVNGRIVLAHRLAFEVANGVSLTPNVMVLHSCDNPPCCNPDHVHAGGAAQNSREMVERGRSGLGERDSQARLTDEAVLAIFEEYRRGEMEVQEIATRFGVSAAAVVDAVRGRTWRHLTHRAPPARRGVGGRRRSVRPARGTP